jgi:natural product biosynthesis luciferase-like monooxygenase protein
MSAFRGVFVGKGRLLIACAETWLGRGHSIFALISDCPEVAAWSQRKGLPRFATSQDALDLLRREPFDYLFSIVNHAIASPELIATPRHRSINYHDSALPDYAGFNATSWAIIDGRHQHGISWHEMASTVDSGNILLQQFIEIQDDDTAFTLDAKCAEAGAATFPNLVGKLEAEIYHGIRIAAVPQGSQQGFHFRSERPGLGIVDFRNTTAEVSALVRGLDFGNDDSWMCRPKLAIGSDLLLIRQIVRVAAPRAAPGSIIELTASHVTIATSDGAVSLSDLTTIDGEPISLTALGLGIGQILPNKDFAAAASLDAAATKHERFWRDRLASLNWPQVPELRPQPGAAEGATLSRQFPASLARAEIADRRSALIAALAIYIAKTGADGEFDLLFRKSVPDALLAAYADTAPLRLRPDLDDGFPANCSAVADELLAQDRRGIFARDMVTRYAALRHKRADKSSAPIGICFQRDDAPQADAMIAGVAATLVLPDLGGSYYWHYDRRAVSDGGICRLADRVDALLTKALVFGAAPMGTIDALPDDERTLLLTTWQDTATPYASDLCIHQLFEQQVARTPSKTAVVFQDKSLTYRELNERANRVAETLMARGVGPESLVAICIDRSLEMVVGLLAVLKAGGAYVPLDPAYPQERLAMMLQDSKARVLLTQRRLADRLAAHSAQVLCIEEFDNAGSAVPPLATVQPDNLAYVIFTSGSTGRPKGVMIRHRNVTNFFTGMDTVIGTTPGVWLAVTSISFDISVLEIFWTLTRGFELVVQGETDRASLSNKAATTLVSKAPMHFGLFYFAADQGQARPGETYRLLLEGARFADSHDFSAVWTPERHFHAFGGLYPNPAVTTAALATITSRIALRAGSVVLPLHDPLRVAEDWSVVDQLSAGRVGLSFASGWHADDFAFMPQAYEHRRELMLEHIETVLKLWRGESVERQNGLGATISVTTLPRPIQKTPPMWIAAAGSIDTFKLAGRIGANILTNMLGQDIDDLRIKFAAYRESRAAAGHAGAGTVSLMLHTFVCEDTEKAREQARAPFCNYLKSSFDLIKVAPFMFPAFKQPSKDDAGATGLDTSSFTDEDMDALLDHAFDRYFETAGLFGAPERALEMVERLKAIGVNEIACLVDFGIDADTVLDSLPHLDRLRRLSNLIDIADNDRAGFSIPEQIAARGVTHMQCTPSMARMITSAPEGLAGIGGLQRLLLGGEALPTELADALAPAVQGKIINMYGPTETTIWSTTSRVLPGAAITIGRPIANTVIRILDNRGHLCPIGVSGELCIGGAGVARGYLDRPDLTAERFVTDPYDSDGVVYRTGDLARYAETGDIEFLGRLDLQVKVNGYRIELGEIETVLSRHPEVRQNVVMARNDDGDPRLVAYVIPSRASSAANDSGRVAQWQRLWDTTYRQTETGTNRRFNFSGWNDSYTGAPIPADAMSEWLDEVGRSILALRPKRVLEIGCGTGMVLYRIMPHVDHYSAIDVSQHALDVIAEELTPDEASKTSLRLLPAHGLDGFEKGSFDTVVINSVAQYFPDAGYLTDVLRRAGDLVRDGGRIYVGDIRSRDHLDAFHTIVALNQAPGHLDAAELARRVEHRCANEGELVLSEAFFHALMRELPRIAAVETRLKAAKSNNEMSSFRYDVVLHIDATALDRVPLPPVTEADTLDEIAQGLSKMPPIMVLRNLKNARLTSVLGIRALMAKAQAPKADELKRLLDDAGDGIDPHALASLDPAYDVEMFWSRSGDPALFDAVFRHKASAPNGLLAIAAPISDEASASYANRPATVSDQGVLFQELRKHLREFLPDYMVPATFVELDTFPLTPNGKTDRKALPAPHREAVRTIADFVAPTNALEQTIADVWKGILSLDRVGLRENIFDLGANSLLTAQANQRLSALLNRRVSLVSMFRFPTVETLAAHLDNGDAARDRELQQTLVKEDRKRGAAERRRELREAMGSQ